jgi:glucose dehydrogenase
MVAGSGFSAGADVDIYFDITHLALVVTDDTGSFSRTALQVPASALAGRHSVSAVDRSTGARAETRFSVGVEWAQFRKQANHCGYNPHETVLSPTTVGGLGLRWKYTTGSGVFSSPAVANGMVYIGSEDNNIYALNASTGALVWKYNSGSGVFSSLGQWGGL